MAISLLIEIYFMMNTSAHTNVLQMPYLHDLVPMILSSKELSPLIYDSIKGTYLDNFIH